MVNKVSLNNFIIKNDTDRLTLIAGPCLLESEKLVYNVANKLVQYSKKRKI